VGNHTFPLSERDATRSSTVASVAMSTSAVT
jgi:hypothetical protein